MKNTSSSRRMIGTCILCVSMMHGRVGWSFPLGSSNPTTPMSTNSQQEERAIVLTTALLRISYDGTRFTGWSAANDGNDPQFRESTKSTRRRQRRGGNSPVPKGFVRSVEGVLRDNLAKIYGAVDPRRVVVEGCSRTDKGVHAVGMMAQIYCLKPGVLEQLDSPDENNSIESSIPGKRIPHPKTPSDDSYFEPLPMNGNLSRLAFALNRMRPSDVQVTGIAPVPRLPLETSSSTLPFHPTLSSRSKQYEYRISTGAFQDPMKKGESWYVGKIWTLPRWNRDAGF